MLQALWDETAVMKGTQLGLAIAMGARSFPVRGRQNDADE